MNMNEYQDLAVETAIYDDEFSVIYPTLGLVGEAGEVAEKIKKGLRDGVEDEEAWIKAMSRELGDVLWYLAAISRDLGLTLEEVADENLAKLADRAERSTLQGSGDDR